MYELHKEKYLGTTKNCFKTEQGISVVETEYHQKVFEGWHSHHNAHITLFLKGGTTEKRKNHTETLRSGSLLFYHSDELHLNLDTLFPSRNINIEIEETLLTKLDLSEAAIERSIENKSHVKFLILKIFRETMNPDAFSEDTIGMLFSQLSGSSAHTEKLAKSPLWVKTLRELLQVKEFENSDACKPNSTVDDFRVWMNDKKYADESPPKLFKNENHQVSFTENEICKQVLLLGRYSKLLIRKGLGDFPELANEEYLFVSIKRRTFFNENSID